MDDKTEKAIREAAEEIRDTMPALRCALEDLRVLLDYLIQAAKRG